MLWKQGFICDRKDSARDPAPSCLCCHQLPPLPAAPLNLLPSSALPTKHLCLMPMLLVRFCCVSPHVPLSLSPSSQVPYVHKWERLLAGSLSSLCLSLHVAFHTCGCQICEAPCALQYSAPTSTFPMFHDSMQEECCDNASLHGSFGNYI